jgi:diacylglycerol kinase
LDSLTLFLEAEEAEEEEERDREEGVESNTTRVLKSTKHAVSGVSFLIRTLRGIHPQFCFEGKFQQQLMILIPDLVLPLQVFIYQQQENGPE